jgi:hypothetical protein
MAEKIDKEINAIKTILTTLESLDDDVRKNVLEYVLKRINYSFNDHILRSHESTQVGASSPNDPVNTLGQENEVIHIKQFKANKLPKSAIDMAAIVAYYLQYLAEPDKRKDSVGPSDLETWFRIAEFPLPTGQIRFTLTNGAKSGYFTSAGSGKYKLSAVGYNLVQHNLPRQNKNGVSNRRNVSNKKATKKNSKAERKSTKK